MKNGVPFSVVFECDYLDEYERMAFSIIFSEFEGSEFDWDSMTFKEKK
ncbi:hypothetical protein HK44_020665 [Pseudomonas fluorescens HK44]|uniref:Uncharacterized protein n=1 Tax=Pseudomonas fluorescens HK44 TaxID=1042209 RepID=A0A010T048_PSEFL|nr:hypothetical protein HK44_020665 [Pseudomonas fluorescens HK44]